MKKIITLIIALLFIGTVYAVALNDVAGNKNETAINYLYENGVISGYSDGSFQPDKTLNRAELLKILVGGMGVQPSAAEYKNCFPDVKEEWFAPYVCYAKMQGWVGGYPDGTFRPAQTVNKAEAIKMTVNSQGYEVPNSVSETLYSDVDNGQWYAPFIKVAKDKGLLEETGSIFGVTNDMKRGAISENIYRAMIIKNTSALHFAAPSEETFYKVVKVVDGDTISVSMNGETVTVRLIGVDTPETVDPRKPVQCFGKEASDKAKEVLTGASVKLEQDETQGDKDIYNRLLRYVILEDGTNFDEMMIKEGYGHEYTYDTPYKYQKEFQEAENYARDNKKGLWADNVCAEDTETIEYEDQTTTSGLDVSTYTCQSNTYNCTDFETHAEAQAVYDKCMTEKGTDIHRLDANGDGDACEDLP
jgi:endonuclease YncB( thermonuclease family)